VEQNVLSTLVLVFCRLSILSFLEMSLAENLRKACWNAYYEVYAYYLIKYMV